MISIDDIQNLLAVHPPVLLPEDSRTRAAVALILRQKSRGTEILFIERAQHEKDPWSGDLGFPGGKLESRDLELRQAAERETFEEIGLCLKKARFLGRLDDIAGAHLPIVISCFVYGVGNAAPFILSDEVNEAFWIPLENLLDPDRHIEAPVQFRGEKLCRPAIRLLTNERRVLWGITYRLVTRFLVILNQLTNPETEGGKVVCD